LIFPVRYYANCVSTTLTVLITLKVSISFIVTLYYVPTLSIITYSLSYNNRKKSILLPESPDWKRYFNRRNFYCRHPNGNMGCRYCSIHSLANLVSAALFVCWRSYSVGKGLILQPLQKPGDRTICRPRITRKTCGKFRTLETKLR
jgi:hypothetical protein